MKSLLLGSLLAAVALFFWGFLYYGATGIPYGTLAETDDVGPALNELFPTDGTYVVPSPLAEDSAELTARGPFAMVHIHKGGSDMMSASFLIGGFLHGFVYCLLLGLLLQQICKKTQFWGRVGFLTLAGVAGAVMARAGDAIWWLQPWGWQLSNILYTVIGSAIAGLVLAKFIKSPVRSDA